MTEGTADGVIEGMAECSRRSPLNSPLSLQSTELADKIRDPQNPYYTGILP
ncbi:MAG: hypothetical protein RRB22_11820 [Gammaproteobacteria bacterium]|nr:hypothetical protein [Gammaproteobacteria bacterium]